MFKPCLVTEFGHTKPDGFSRCTQPRCHQLAVFNRLNYPLAHSITYATRSVPAPT